MLYFYRGLREAPHQSARINDDDDDDDDDDEIFTKGGLLTDINLELVACSESRKVQPRFYVETHIYHESGSWQLQ